MIPVFLPADVQAMDARAFDRGVDPAALMDRAAHHLTRGVLDQAAARGLSRYGLGVVLVCGKGNNGGDGIAAARHLAARGAAPTVVLVAPPADLCADAARELAAWQALRGRIVVASDRAALDAAVHGADVVVDCLLGTGSGGAPRGIYADAVAAINEVRVIHTYNDVRVRHTHNDPHVRHTHKDVRARHSHPQPNAHAWLGDRAAAGRPLVVACDLPTGLDGADGSVAGQAVRADVTVTLGAHKQGLWLAEGPAYSGQVVLGELDVIDDAADPVAHILVPADLPGLLPQASRVADKRARGVVAIWAGSAGLTGAAVLAARGALAAGAGLVTVASHPRAAAVVRAAVPEAMTIDLPEDTAGICTRIEELSARVDVLAMGPGLGLAEATQKAVRRLVATVQLPVVLDADGLNAFRDHRGDLAAHASRLLAMTPHAAELGRLMGLDADDVDRRRRDVAVELASLVGATIVAKGPGSVVAAPDGRVWINVTGGPALATGGTGDVLTGVTAALLAQRPDPATVAAAVHLHGLAGDLAAAGRSVRATTAGAVADALGDAAQVLGI